MLLFVQGVAKKTRPRLGVVSRRKITIVILVAIKKNDSHRYHHPSRRHCHPRRHHQSHHHQRHRAKALTCFDLNFGFFMLQSSPGTTFEFTRLETLITQIGLAIPLLILYELSIFSVNIIEKKNNKNA